MKKEITNLNENTIRVDRGAAREAESILFGILPKGSFSVEEKGFFRFSSYDDFELAREILRAERISIKSANSDSWMESKEIKEAIDDYRSLFSKIAQKNTDFEKAATFVPSRLSSVQKKALETLASTLGVQPIESKNLRDFEPPYDENSEYVGAHPEYGMFYINTDGKNSAQSIFAIPEDLWDDLDFYMD